MMQQLESWFGDVGDVDLRQSVQPKGMKVVIAQVFFPFDDDTLDRHDKRCVWALARYIRTKLHRNERVDVSVIGHADHRGNRTYNRDLGARRALRVIHHLKQCLPHEPNFTALPWLSRGEGQAMQGTRDPQKLANDRRVDVNWGVPGPGEFEFPKPRQIPGAVRFVLRR